MRSSSSSNSSSSSRPRASILHVVVVVALLLLSFMGSSLASTNNAKNRLRRSFSINQALGGQSYGALMEQCRNNPEQTINDQTEIQDKPFNLFNIYKAFAASSCGVARRLKSFPVFQQPFAGLFVQPWYNCFNLNIPLGIGGVGSTRYKNFQDTASSNQVAVVGGMGAFITPTPGAHLHFQGAQVTGETTLCEQTVLCESIDAGPGFTCDQSKTVEKSYTVTNENSFSVSTTEDSSTSFAGNSASFSSTQQTTSDTTKEHGTDNTASVTSQYSNNNICASTPCHTASSWHVTTQLVADQGTASGYSSYQMRGQVGVWYSGESPLFGTTLSPLEMNDLHVTAVGEDGQLYIQDIVEVFIALGVPTYSTLQEALDGPSPGEAELGVATPAWGSKCYVSGLMAQGIDMEFNTYSPTGEWFDGVKTQDGKYSQVTLPANTYSVVNGPDEPPFVLIKDSFDYTGPLNYEVVGSLNENNNGFLTMPLVNVKTTTDCPS